MTIEYRLTQADIGKLEKAAEEISVSDSLFNRKLALKSFKYFLEILKSNRQILVLENGGDE